MVGQSVIAWIGDSGGLGFSVQVRFLQVKEACYDVAGQLRYW